MNLKYIKITLRISKENSTHYFIENDYGKTNEFVHLIDLIPYIQARLNEGTIVETIPN